MNILIAQDQKGHVLSVHRTVDGAAHFIMAHGRSPSIKDQESYSIKTLNDALMAAARAEITFADGTPPIRLEVHGLYV